MLPELRKRAVQAVLRDVPAGPAKTWLQRLLQHGEYACGSGRAAAVGSDETAENGCRRREHDFQPAAVCAQASTTRSTGEREEEEALPSARGTQVQEPPSPRCKDHRHGIPGERTKQRRSR